MHRGPDDRFVQAPRNRHRNGAAKADAGLRDVDILAVQLPPAAVADTSGRRLDPYVVMGLRWMVTEALRLCRARGGPVPLVVNISLGSLGGPGDASAFLSAVLQGIEGMVGMPSYRVPAAGVEEAEYAAFLV